jgi:hypothetical protein
MRLEFAAFTMASVSRRVISPFKSFSFSFISVPQFYHKTAVLDRLAETSDSKYNSIIYGVNSEMYAENSVTWGSGGKSAVLAWCFCHRQDPKCLL